MSKQIAQVFALALVNAGGAGRAGANTSEVANVIADSFMSATWDCHNSTALPRTEQVQLLSTVHQASCCDIVQPALVDTIVLLQGLSNLGVKAANNAIDTYLVTLSSASEEGLVQGTNLAKCLLKDSRIRNVTSE